MNNRKKSVRNLAFSLIGQIITIALGIVLPRLYIVSYGSEVNGMLSTIQQFLSYLSLFEAGIGATVLQALYSPVAKMNHDEINGVMSATNVFYKKTATYYGGGLLLLGFIYPLFLKTSLSYLFMVSCVILSGVGNFALYLVHAKYKLLLQADGRYYVSVNLSTAMTILTSVAKIVLIALGKNVVSVLAVSAAVQLIPAWFLTAYVRKNYPFLNLSAEPQFDKIRERNYMLIHQIAGMVFQNTDLLVISMICGLKLASVYAIYRMIISHLESILTIPISSVGFVLGQTYQTDKDKFRMFIDVFERWNAVLFFSVYTVTLRLFVPFISIYMQGVTDVKYTDSVLAVLFVMVAVLTACRVPMLNTINYAGKFKDTVPQTIAETLINLIITVPATFLWGIYGALLGTIVALLYRTNDVIIYANKRLLNRSPLGTYAIYVEQIVIAIPVLILLRLFNSPGSYIQFFKTGVEMSLVSITCYIVINLLISKESRRIIKHYIVKRRCEGNAK